MARAGQEVLRDVLDLPEREQLDVVTEVLARMHGEAESGWDAAWLAELDRRELAEAAEPGADEEWSSVRARITNG